MINNILKLTNPKSWNGNSGTTDQEFRSKNDTQGTMDLKTFAGKFTGARFFPKFSSIKFNLMF